MQERRKNNRRLTDVMAEHMQTYSGYQKSSLYNHARILPKLDALNLEISKLSGMVLLTSANLDVMEQLNKTKKALGGLIDAVGGR